jgi:hypothetical protein
MSLSLATAWDETAALAKREAARIFPAAFLLLALPAAILRAIAPVTAPGRLPESGLWLLLVPAVLAASLIGALSICRLALIPGESMGAALRGGLRGSLPLLGAALIAGAAGLLLVAAAILLAAALGSILPVLAALIAFVFVWVRLILLTPVAAAEPAGPLRLIRRGWALTSGSFWRLLGALLVTAILSLVALIAAGAIGGIAVRLAAGQPQPGTLALLLVLWVSALLQTAIGGFFTVFLARLYAQLAENRPH